tara:strand:- start:311 stop:586 length:276 start_codon:yes stop_codon:yes gene_type:complete
MKDKPVKKRGRPPGQRAAQLEFQRLMTENADAEKVIDMIIEAALDDNHKNQAVAWKILMDRLLPVSACEKQQGRSSIEINITGLETPKVLN